MTVVIVMFIVDCNDPGPLPITVLGENTGERTPLVKVIVGVVPVMLLQAEFQLDFA